MDDTLFSKYFEDAPGDKPAKDTGKTELRPCPFCGGKSVLANRCGGWTIDCEYYDPIKCIEEDHPECSVAGTDFFETPEDAAEFWNTRPMEDGLRHENTALRAELDALRAELAKAQALNALLQAEPGKSMVIRCGELEAEVSRLRAALAKHEAGQTEDKG